MNIKVLPAKHGDCLLIRYLGNDAKYHNILVDGGPRDSFATCLKPAIENIISTKENLDLVVLTHIDADHIGGILEMLADYSKYGDLINKLWFNSYVVGKEKYKGENFPEKTLTIKSRNHTKGAKNQSPNQAVTLEKLLSLTSIDFNKDPVMNETVLELFGAKIIVLSPNEDLFRMFLNTTPELKNGKNQSKANKDQLSIDELAKEIGNDPSPYNRSSIVLLIKANKKSVLLLADSNPNDVTKLIKDRFQKLEVDLVKVSHHGSAANSNQELFKIIYSDNFILSSNGREGNPTKSALSKILKARGEIQKDITFYFNYNIARKIFTDIEIYKYKINCIYGTDGELNITL